MRRSARFTPESKKNLKRDFGTALVNSGGNEIDEDPFYKRSLKPDGRCYRFYRCVECEKEQRAEIGKSIDGGASRKWCQ